MIRFLSRYIYLILLMAFASCKTNEEKNIQPAVLVDSIVHEQLPPAEDEPVISPINCDYRDTTITLGIGLVCMPQKCKFYNDAQLTDLYMEWDFAVSYDPPQPACALYYKPDYGIAHYVCLDSTEKYYRILVNGNEEKYIPHIYGKIFKDWFTYISGSIGGIDLPRENGRDSVPIMIKPSENSAVILVNVNMANGGRSFCPLEMKGDWLKVKLDCYLPDEKFYTDCRTYIPKECPDTPTGWIRWRKGNKILVEIHQLL